MNREYAVKFWHCFAVLQTIGKNAERKGFRFRDGLIAGVAVSESAGDINDIADPAAVILALDFYREVAHPAIVTDSVLR